MGVSMAVMKTKFRQEEKIELTSFAEEASLLPAASPSASSSPTMGKSCKIESTERASTTGSKSALRNMLLFTALVGISCLWAYGGARISELGMDWGYYVVKGVVGQDLEGSQNVGAQILMILVAPVIYGTFAFSALRTFFKGTWHWFLFFPIGFLAVMICFAGIPNSIKDILPVSPYLAGMSAAAFVLHCGYSWIIRELDKRIKAKQLLSSIAVAILPAAIFLTTAFGFEDLSENLNIEIPLYSAMLLAAGICAANVVRARKFSSGLSASIFATFPLHVFNLANIAFGIFCSTFGSYFDMRLDWHAPLSALIITISSIVAVAGGAAIGTHFSRAKANRWLLASRS